MTVAGAATRPMHLFDDDRCFGHRHAETTELLRNERTKQTACSHGGNERLRVLTLPIEVLPIARWKALAHPPNCRADLGMGIGARDCWGLDPIVIVALDVAAVLRSCRTHAYPSVDVLS
jgi:hypothetical protein